MKIKKIFFVLFLAACLFFFLAPGNYPDNSIFKKELGSAFGNKTVIIFNSGGWGNTPLKEAKDFFPIIEGIEQTLDRLGSESVVVSYERTKNDFFGRVEGLREFFTSFPYQSLQLANEIETFKKQYPDSKIIIAGLSNGAIFVDRVMERIAKKDIKDVFAIEVGVPFWEQSLESENVLSLDNEGKDPLAKGEISILFISLLKAPFKLLLAKIYGQDIAFPHIFHTPGHDYFWESPLTGSRITSFIEDRFAF